MPVKPGAKPYNCLTCGDKNPENFRRRILARRRCRANKSLEIYHRKVAATGRVVVRRPRKPKEVYDPDEGRARRSVRLSVKQYREALAADERVTDGVDLVEIPADEWDWNPCPTCGRCRWYWTRGDLRSGPKRFVWIANPERSCVSVAAN